MGDMTGYIVPVLTPFQRNGAIELLLPEKENGHG